MPTPMPTSTRTDDGMPIVDGCFVLQELIDEHQPTGTQSRLCVHGCWSSAGGHSVPSGRKPGYVGCAARNAERGRSQPCGRRTLTPPEGTLEVEDIPTGTSLRP